MSGENRAVVRSHTFLQGAGETNKCEHFFTQLRRELKESHIHVDPRCLHR